MHFVSKNVKIKAITIVPKFYMHENQNKICQKLLGKVIHSYFLFFDELRSAKFIIFNLYRQRPLAYSH